VIGRVEALAKTRSPAKSNALSGPDRGRGALLAIALVALGLLAALWFWSDATRRAPDSLELSPPAAEPAVPAPRSGEPARLPADPDPMPGDAADDAAPDLALRPARPRAEDERRFQGAGSLRGHVEVEGDQPFPAVWRLELVPSTILSGAERAATRTLEFSDGRQDFEVQDLPFGSYDVAAIAEGFNAHVHPLVIERGNPSPFVNLHLVPAGTIEGRVVDAQGLGLEGVPMTLRAVTSELEWQARSNAGGVFRFERVRDGPYELVVGHSSSPILAERRALRFTAPWMNLPDIELPALGEFLLEVIDPLEQPVAGVSVRGSGTPGGLIDETTDAEGRVRARHLPAGHYRIRIEHEVLGGQRFAIDLEPGEVEQARFVLAP
jgi:hypothetical protein